ncbi:MAG: LPXTG cell wall anchor domain-containing protein [Bacillota bacterium]|nr:LPXTG cell wall anchor domain-containing protein [Bacillota bacterium]
MKKRLLAIIATAAMVVTMIPSMVFADGPNYVNGSILYNLGKASTEEQGISIELQNLTGETEKSVKVELYSGDNLLITKEKAGLGVGTTCTFYTNSKSSSWTETPTAYWAYDDFVPTKAVVSHNGKTQTYNIPASVTAKWAELDGTDDISLGGGILVDSMATENEAGICYEALNVPKNAKVRVELYAGDKYLTYKEITVADGADTLTCTFYTVGTSSSWKQDTWTAYDNVLPTHAVLYINGIEIDSDDVEFTSEEWIPFPGTLAPPAPPAEKPEKSPNTGDNSMAPIAVAGLALAAMAAVVATRRRTN